MPTRTRAFYSEFVDREGAVSDASVHDSTPLSRRATENYPSLELSVETARSMVHFF
jgi:hypothetical protein